MGYRRVGSYCFGLIHVVVAAVASVSAAALLLFFRLLGDQSVAGQKQDRDAGRVDQGGAGNLGGVVDCSSLGGSNLYPFV